MRHDARFRRLVVVTVAAGLFGVAGLVTAAYGVYRLTTTHTSTSVVPASSTLHRGAKAPLTSVLDSLLGGHSINLQAMTSGRPVVINFFASWCQACTAELRAFSEVAKQEKNHVVFIGIDTNDGDPTKAISLLRAAHTTYPVGIDTTHLGLADAYGVANLPTTFFLDRSGHLVSGTVGIESAPRLRAAVDKLLTSNPH